MSSKDIESRRKFLRQATSAVGLALTAPAIASIIASCEYDETLAGSGEKFTIKIADYPELSEVGGITAAVISTLNDGNAVFISRVEENKFAVFTTVCTHQGCPVDLPFAPDEDLWCPCHASVFERETGKIIQQPTQGTATDLPRFRSRYDPEPGTLTIDGDPEIR